MSIEKRRFIRFSLDIPALYFSEKGENNRIFVRQISIGGCLAELNDSVLIGDEFRLEFILPNKNRLPLYGKAVYQFAGKGVGVKFKNISQFEQELIGKIISESLESEGLPLLVDPFLQHPDYGQKLSIAKSEDKEERQKVDDLIEEAITT